MATTTNGMTVYCNPAGMAFDHGWDLQFPLVTADATMDGDLFDRIDQVQDDFDSSSLTEIQDRFNNGTASDQDLQSALDAFLYKLPALELSQQGGNVRAVSGPAFRWKNWGISAGCLGNGGIDSTIDLQNGLNLGSSGFTGAIPSPTSCMKDADGDDYGDLTPPAGVTSGTDCDDDASAVNQGATEICDGIDNDCDTDIDEGC